MALLSSLVFLLLLTLIGLSSMQNATLQEKMAAGVVLRNQSFQAAESALRVGESAVQLDSYSLAACESSMRCAPPAESAVVAAAGLNASSGVIWIAVGHGFYGVQKLGTTLNAVNVPGNTSATLYRVTAIGLSGHSRSVLESIHAKYAKRVFSGAGQFNGMADIPSEDLQGLHGISDADGGSGAFSGKMLDQAALDTNGDGSVDSSDIPTSDGVATPDKSPGGVSRRIMWRQIQ